MYAFGLYTTPDGWGYICPTANTEEGLLQKYTEYIQRGHNSDMNSLRWGPCDWIYHLEGIDFFNDVEKIMVDRYYYFFKDNDRYLTDEYERDNELILQTCIEALGELDRKFIFGKGESRESLVINIFKGDRGEQELIDYAKLLNPPNVYNRFKEELIEIYKYFYKMAMGLAEEDEISPDEDFTVLRTLFSLRP